MTDSQAEPDWKGLTDAEWHDRLDHEQFHILREKGTERAFTGVYWDANDPGVYHCAGCGLELFDSTAKFESSCGWPSFSDTIAAGRVEEHADHSHGMTRTEITCARCGGHLGHVFPDGPRPTGLRYCVNSASIELGPRPDDH